MNSPFIFPLSVALTYGLLALAVCAAWLKPIKAGAVVLPPWTLLLAAACASGWWFGLLAPPALLTVLGFGVLAGVALRQKAGVLRTVLLIATGAMTLAMSLHKFPGFVNPALVAEMQLSAASPAFTHRLNFDTATAGLILFALFCVPAHNRQQWRDIGRNSWIILGTPALVLLAGVAGGFVAWDPKVSAYTPLFLAANLLFTCVTEEAFFRGFIQHRLAGAMDRWRAGPYLALGIAAILFGVAHARGGPALIVLATVAGLGYGYAYLRSKRIEAAILTHFLLNGLHFVFFTYPRAL